MIFLDLVSASRLSTLLGTSLALALFTSCGGPKEAENPRELLGSDLNHEGVYGGGSAPDTPGAPSEAPSVPGAASARNTKAPKRDALATRAECELAARHLVALGVDIAIREESDPETKQRMIADREEALKSERARTHRSEWTRECLLSGTLASEARCIARIQNERDIDRCVGEP